MVPELTCAAARAALSARLDGELDDATGATLDAHLLGCSACSSYERDLLALRRTLRVQPMQVEAPDLTEAIMRRIPTPSMRPRSEVWTSRLRTAAIAAVVAALVVGVSLPFVDRPRSIASASEVVREIRAAARSLVAYRATFALQERGWHPEVPQRSFEARVSFRTPESLRLEIRDRTPYPGNAWPRNDVKLVATPNTWWLREPTSCPTEVLPYCAAARAAEVERRRVFGRQPFDGSTPLPTDVIVPLETLSDARAIKVVGPGSILGRSAERVALAYRYAAPLIASFQSAGTWREFHPLDRVEIWLDRETWFPLRFEITAAVSSERQAWAAARGADDAAGGLLFAARATRFEPDPSLSASTFAVPETGIDRYAGFTSREIDGAIARWLPRDTAGLSSYRSGSLGPGRSIASYTRGMTWMKVTVVQGDGRSVPEPGAEEIELGAGSWAYYEPAASGLGRRVVLFGSPRIILETNLPRATLLRVAGSVDHHGQRAPRRVRTGSSTITYVRPEDAGRTAPFTRVPSWLPTAYRATSATVTSMRDGARSVTLYFRHPEVDYEGSGIRITQSRPVRFLPPTSTDPMRVSIGAKVARWSAGRGELEWLDSGVYRAVVVPSGDLATALRIAHSML